MNEFKRVAFMIHICSLVWYFVVKPLTVGLECELNGMTHVSSRTMYLWPSMREIDGILECVLACILMERAGY